MCPELDILSTYYDNEIEASLREKIKKHVDSCPSCQEKLAEFDKISEMLHEDEPDFDEAQSNVWDRIMNSIDTEEEKPEAVSPSPATFWHRKIQLSVPAAAALAAAFIAVFSIGMFSFFAGRSNVPTNMNPEISITDASGSVIDDNLLNDKAIEFNIPVANNYIRAGEPMLIREVDFRNRNGRY